ncbi:MAG: hypothetical protein LBI10_00325, partial [Deltaproteobacteria bacterium]|nr:hypothetical protein [Deltaproteobacteria bacterium]
MSANRLRPWDFFNGLKFLGTLSLVTLIFFALTPKAFAADIRDYFVKVPDNLAHGLSAVDRRALLDTAS